MPTCQSERKLHNMYKFMYSDVESIDELKSDPDTSTDTEEGEEDTLELEEPHGFRIIGVECLLSQNIASKLSGSFGNSSVQLYEMGRKGLASSFLFHSSTNKHWDVQTKSPSCPHIPVAWVGLG